MSSNQKNTSLLLVLLVSFIDWMITLKYCAWADRIVVNSEFMRNNVVFWYRMNPDKVVVIPNGVNLKMFTESNGKMLLEGDPSILYVGHLSGLKGIDILIKDKYNYTLNT